MGGIMKCTLILVFVCLCVSLAAMADIQVSYTGFNTEQQAAFEYAVGIWEPLLNSPVPITIHATLQTIPGFVVITLPNLIRNFTGAPVQNVWFSTALANSLSGTDLNPTEADVDFIVNPTQPWYYGLDGACPGSSIDFVTEMIKATAYGLGYQSSFYVQQGYGSYGMIDPSVLGLSTSFVWEPMQNLPALYDTFICNTQAQYLTDTGIFPNPSPALHAQLTGGNLRYHGPHAMQYAAGEEPVLYANGFNLARTARLLESAYTGSENASGVPTAYNGLVIHYPAPIVLGILQDQGWQLALEEILLAPTNLSATLVQNDVYLSWTEPDTPYTIHDYKICRDGAEIATSEINAYSDLGLAPGMYAYTVEARYSMGMSEPSNIVSIEIPVAIEDDMQTPEVGIKLCVHPDPFADKCSMTLSLKDAGNVTVDVYDIRGRKLGNIYHAYHNGGSTLINWNACLGNGQHLPAGIYLLKAENGRSRHVEKALILK